MIAREVVVEGRELLDAQLFDLDFKLGHLGGEARVGMLGRIKNPQRQVSTAVLTDELVLQREREAAAAGFEEHRLAVNGLSTVEAARQLDSHHVAGLDEATVLYRVQVRH